MEPHDIQQIGLLEDRLRRLTVDFRQTREFCRLNSGKADNGTVSFDIKDILIIAAITNSDLLFTGKSGGGKTHLSKMTMNAVFGSGNYVNRTITPGMNEEAFIDIDFGKIKEGATLKESMGSTPILTHPGVILNEANRAPALIQNILIPYLEYEFNIKGLDFSTGLPLPDGGRYQLRFMTINEGAEYKGVAETDKAVRDRMVIEIPIDQFKSLKGDITDMVKGRKSSGVTVEDAKESLTDQVLELYGNLTNIPLSPMAAKFLVYLSGLSNCIKSNTGSKEGIAFTLDVCRGCNHAKGEVPICGNVYAPTNRSLINMSSVGRGIAAMRAYRTLVREVQAAGSDSKKRRAVTQFMGSDYLRNLRVEVEDVNAIAPFILYSKIQLNQQWMKKHFQGNKFLAVQYVMQTAQERFSTFYRDHYKELLGYQTTGDDTSFMNFLRKYAKEKDPWMANIHDFENRSEDYELHTGEIIGGWK